MTFFGAATPSHHQSPRAARRAVTLAALSLTLLLSLSNSARAQDDKDDEVVRVETDLVTVPAVVTDARGRRVQGLAREDFDVRDEGRAVELSYFASGTERVALTFLLDASGSARDILEGQREAALALFSRFGAGSRVSVIHFQERPEISLPLTSDLERARAAFRFVSLPDRRTAIFDAAQAAVRSFWTPRAADPTERRIVILISDGLDTASASRAPAVVAGARENNVTFYVIHTPLYAPRDGRLRPRQPSEGFKDLAEKTGGQFFVLGDVAAAFTPGARPDLQPIFQAIDEDLRGQYVLGYYAGEAERATRRHRVEVRLKPQTGRKLRVRALRDSYELQPRPADAAGSEVRPF
jgi:Ca-activated chloride channel family protein